MSSLRGLRNLSTSLVAIAALLATVVRPTMLSAKTPTECDANCLTHIMSLYLDHSVRHLPTRKRVAEDAVIRENIATVRPEESVWKPAGKIVARQDFADATTGNIYSWVTLKQDAGRIIRLAERLRVRDAKISEIETISADSDRRLVPHDVIAPERRSTREDLIGLANGYFEAVGMLDPGAAKLSPNCLVHEAGRAAPCASRLVNRVGQQAIERRFPVAIPELGVVVGYTLVMHHERTPPQDELIAAVFRIQDGSILEIDAVALPVPAPGRSGFGADFPDPGIIRGAPPEPPLIVPPTPEPWHFPGYWRVRTLLEYGTFRAPEVQVPTPPYPGITDVRDIAYGADPMQRLDILAPSERTDKPRTVLVFVHGGAWEGGKRRVFGDTLYENVVLWAAQHGMVGVNIDYRLADYKASRNLYPTQEQDVAAAMDWIGDNIANYGGDPNRIFMWGHSAGGTTIAGYASNPLIYGLTPGVKGIFLLSSPLDPTVEERNGQPIRYFGRTHQEFVEHSPLKTLAKCDVPVLFGYSPQEKELPPELEQERRALCKAGHCPRTVFTKGSHSQEIRAVGTTDRSASDAMLAFMASIP